jgi:dihydrofolate synthase/folylpolyglutamate synthase
MRILGSVDEASSLVAVAKTAAPQKLKIEKSSRNLPPINLPLLGECQRENCALAVATLEILADMLDFEPAFKKGLELVEWDARFQTLETDPLVILDGAHNPSAARALVKTLKELYPRQPIGFILGFLDDKETVEFLREIKPLISKAWTIPIDAPRGTTAEATAEQACVAGVEAEASSVSKAWKAAREWAAAEPNRLIVATGSLYLKQILRESGCL